MIRILKYIDLKYVLVDSCWLLHLLLPDSSGSTKFSGLGKGHVFELKERERGREKYDKNQDSSNEVIEVGGEMSFLNRY